MRREGAILGVDFWLGTEAAARYRERKMRGTRLPVRLRDATGGRGVGSGRMVMTFALVPVLIGIAVARLFASGSAGLVGLGVCAIVAIVGGAYALTRYLALPIDPEYRVASQQEP
jgi:hypothetical protein